MLSTTVTATSAMLPGPQTIELNATDFDVPLQGLLLALNTSGNGTKVSR